MSRLRAIAVPLAVLLLATAPAGNQCLSFADLIANQAGNYTWKTSAPASSSRLITQTDLSTYVTGCSATGNRIMTWSDVLACATGHTVAQQSISAAGSWLDEHWTARFEPMVGDYVCTDHPSTGAYSVVLPSGAVAPTSVSTQLTLSLSSINYAFGGAASSTIHVQLFNPSGTQVGTDYQSSAASITINYSNGSAPAGAWKWVIFSTGSAGQTCDSSIGVTGSPNGASWSGTANYYQ